MTLAVPHHPRVGMNEGDQSKVHSVVSWFSLMGEEGGRGQARVPHLWLLTTLYLTPIAHRIPNSALAGVRFLTPR